MPSRNRPPRTRRPQESGPEHRGVESGSIEPARDLASQPVRAADVQPVADTMGNEAAQAAVDEWVLQNHGGPSNPDDPKDAWFWQHKGITDWDFTTAAELDRRGDTTTPTDDGSVSSNYKLKSTAEHERAHKKETTTVIGNGDVGYERERILEDRTTQDEFKAGLQSKRVSVKDDEGEITRTTEGGLNGSALFSTERKDGDATRTNTFAHDARVYGSGKRKGEEKLASSMDGSWNSRWTGTEKSGPDNNRLNTKTSASGTIDAKQSGVGDKRSGRIRAGLSGSHDGERRITDDNGDTSVRKVNATAGVNGQRAVKDGKVTYTGDASLDAAGQRTDTHTRADGAVVTTALTGDGSAKGSSSGKGKRKGEADGEFTALRTVAHKLDDGSTKTRTGAEIAGGIVANTVDGGINRTTTAKAKFHGDHTLTTNLDDGSVSHTGKGALNLKRDATVKADGTRTSTVGGDIGGGWDRKRVIEGDNNTRTNTQGASGKLRGSRAVDSKGAVVNTIGATVRGDLGTANTTMNEDGSKRETHLKGGLAVSGDGHRKEGKTTGTGSVELSAAGSDRTTLANGDVVDIGGSGGVTVFGGTGDSKRGAKGHVSGSRDTLTKLDDGSLKTHLGGAASGGRTVQVVGESGTRITDNASVTGDASRTRTTKIDGGTVDRTLSGKAGLDRTVVTNPDGTSTKSTTGTASVNRNKVTRTRTEDGTKTVTIGGGADVRGGRSIDAKGIATHKAGAGLRGSYQNNSNRTLEDGSTLDRTWSANGNVGGDVERRQGKTTGTGKTGISGGLKTVHIANEGDTKVTTKSNYTALANVDAKSDKTGRGTVGIGADRSVTRSTKSDAGTRDVTTYGKGNLTGNLDRGEKGWKNGQQLKISAGRAERNITTDATGARTTHSLVHEGTANAGRTGKYGETKAQNTAGINLERREKTLVERDTADGTLRQESGTTSKAGANYSTENGFGLTGSHAWNQSNKTTDAQGNSNESLHNIMVGGGWSTKDGLNAKTSAEIIHDRKTTKLSDTLTRTTTVGDGKASANAGVKKDEDGNWQATAAAKASATAFSDNIGYDNGKGLKASAGYEVGKAEADAKGTATLTADEIKVKGSAGAKVTLVGGNAKAEVPAFTWNLLGEPVRVKITAALSASVLAEANGEIELDVSKGDNLGVTVGGGGRAFAGAKAGVEVGAHIQWLRSDDYSALLMDFLDDMPGIGWAVDDVPLDLWKQVSTVLIGTGTSDLLIGKAGVHGSAGIGGEASFGLSLQGGRVKMNGDLNGAIGIGGGAKTSLDLDAVDGIRFGGVLLMRGVEWIKKHIGGAASWANQIIDEAQKRIDAYMEEKKAEGGWGGMWAGAVDWVGDDLFDLW